MHDVRLNIEPPKDTHIQIRGMCDSTLCGKKKDFANEIKLRMLRQENYSEFWLKCYHMHTYKRDICQKLQKREEALPLTLKMEEESMSRRILTLEAAKGEKTNFLLVSPERVWSCVYLDFSLVKLILEF